MKKLGEEYNKEIGNPLSMEEDEAAVSPIDDSKTVGMADQFEEIMNDLIDLQPGFKIVSLYGMSGIGKTHLASKVNQHPSIVQEFDVRVCASIGPKFRIEKVLADIAAQIDQNPRNEYMVEDKNKLGVRVYKSLSGQKYLVVLDDIWSTAAWSAMKRWFPIERNGSRIVLTTRLEEVAKCPASSNAYQIRWLNNDESWDLLWRTVFDPKNSFPSKLEKAGRKIAENCEGLPRLILEVANILRGHR